MMAEGMRDPVVPRESGTQWWGGSWPGSEGVCFVSGTRSFWGLSVLPMSLC